MRIPGSVVVMAILTCVPFGLALRDETRSAPAPADEVAQAELDQELLQEGRLEAELAERAREEATQGADREARRAAQTAVLRHLYIYDAQFLWGDRVHEPGVTVTYNVDVVKVELTDELLCNELERELVAAWGPGTLAGDGRVWLDPAGFPAGQRVQLFDGGCKLDYDHYTAVETVVTPENSSIVPVSAIGMAAASFSARLAKLDTVVQALQPEGRIVDGDFVSWSVPGIGAGSGRTECKAVVKRGKIVQLYASGNASETTLDELEASITAGFGTSALDPLDERIRRWGHRPAISLLRAPDAHGRQGRVGIGTELAGYTIFVGQPAR